ncbi:ABC transporter substrate-binding protein [Chitinophaga sp. 30R24]|uniref:ABC transporter substrate-binding protein n=1 Tax=Chitinophaga sp. 30R24 TaxID=3248838 RepID=UPI003B916182
MKIGALLPRSTFHPLLHHDFLQGIQAYLQYQQIKADMLTGNIGYGTDADLIAAEAEKMLLENRVDLLIIYADQDTVKKTADLAKALNRLIILVHSGAKYIHDWEPHPAVLSHTLNHTIQCRLTGLYAGKLAPQAAVCTSYYDGGYSHSHTMTEAYIKHGGAIAYNYVSQYKVKDFDTTPLRQFLQTNSDVQTLLALFNGDLAHCFLQQLQESEAAQHLQIFGSPMLLDETLTTTYGTLQLPFRIIGYVPWVSTLNNHQNQLLKTQFQQYTGRDANLPGMHGWSTGIMLGHIYHTTDTHQFRAKDILTAFYDVTLDSPRGHLRMDPDTHHMIAPAYLVQTNEAHEPEVTGSTALTLQIWQEIVQEQSNMAPSSGWINTYLCA